jgi:Ca2+-binding EF-hand superfamily protein
LFNEHDHHNEDDTITADEFCHIWNNEDRSINCWHEASQIFETFDFEFDNRIVIDEFSVFWYLKHGEFSGMNELFNQYDEDFDEQLTPQEFDILYCSEFVGVADFEDFHPQTVIEDFD